MLINAMVIIGREKLLPEALFFSTRFAMYADRFNKIYYFGTKVHNEKFIKK
jgi:hypothetical protein